MRISTIGVRLLGALLVVLCFASTADAQRTVTLRLNTATLPDTLSTMADVQIRGCLDSCADNVSALPGGNSIAWDDRTTLRPANNGGDYWSISFQIPDNETLNFKFYSHDSDAAMGGWEDGDNHQIAAGTGDVTLPLHYFVKFRDNQAYDWRPFAAGEDSIAVWFRVFMDTPAARARGYNPEAEDLRIVVRGNNERGGQGAEGPVTWGDDTGAVLTREDGDSGRPGYHLFSGLIRYPAESAGQSMAYKFFFSPNTGSGWEEAIGDRMFTIPSPGADTTLHWVFFDNSQPSSELATGLVVFEVDTTPVQTAGVFDRTAGDQLEIRGGFNGWGCGEANIDECLMIRNPGTEDYLIATTITAVPGTEQTYKFVINYADEDLPVGWEEPMDVGGGNRRFTFAGDTESPQEVGRQFYNDVREGNAVDFEQDIDLTFNVNMAEATAFASEPFNPATHGVYIQFEDPIWRLTQRTNPAFNPENITDEGILTSFALQPVAAGSTLYTGTIKLMGPSYAGIAYRYVYGDLNDTSTLTVEGQGGFEAGRRRYRHVVSADGSFPAAHTFATDTFKSENVELLPWECNWTDPQYNERVASGFCMATGTADVPTNIEDRGGEVPRLVALGSNYPNPFRGTTVVEYDVPTAQHVRLDVYDLTGRLVSTLVNEVQPAAGYRVQFDANGLASGVYIYRLQSGGEVMTRRMTVIN
ncbi:hypothetical protein BH23BAC4_BH23BAC4_02660 [soil metagenome]